MIKMGSSFFLRVRTKHKQRTRNVVVDLRFCKRERERYIVHVSNYSVWHSRLRVTEVLLFCSISFPSHVWNPGFRLISCFHRYRASPHINTSDPGVRSTGIFVEVSTRRVSASTKLKCITEGDSKETIAMPSSKRIRSTCAPIPCTPQQCVLLSRYILVMA